MDIKVSALMVGVASYVPGLRNFTARRTGGTVSARYCYGVLLRHLARLGANGLPTRFRTVLELGPGDSLGVGLAALLCCADAYCALDVVRYAEPAQNLQVFDELVDLFRARAPVPDEDEFPLIFPTVADYSFPSAILPDDRLRYLLNPNRLDVLRGLLRDPPRDGLAGTPLCYVAPWDASVLADGSVDLILSQSVLQYTPDLRASYAEMARWLRPGGVMSHEIDYKSIGRTRAWNGHWTCPNLVWDLAQGRRRNPLNRQPFSAHLEAQEAAGLLVVSEMRRTRFDGVPRDQLARRFADLSDIDLSTASALIQSRKPPVLPRASDSLLPHFG